MSLKISTADQDQILSMQGGSSLSGYNFPRHNTNSVSKSKTPHLLYLGVISVLVAFLLWNSLSSASPETHQQQSSEKFKELEEKVEAVRKEESTHVELINALRKDLQKAEETMKATTQNKPNTPPAATPAPAPTPLPKQVKNTNKQKHLYMNPNLQKISDFRRQKGGMAKTAEGSVSQIKYLTKNKEGQSIDEVLYENENRAIRKKFQEQRASFTANKKNFPGLYLTSFNNKLDDSRDEEQQRVEAEEYERIDKIWDFSQYDQELPMCIVVPGYNNNAKFRIEYNLNSIFQQNYTNYFVVIINDASIDNSDEVYRKYLDFYQINKDTYAYVENKQRKTALENIYTATHDYCSPDAVVLNLDADDEFIGKNVLKTFNAGYQKHKAGVMYSNFFWYDQGGNIMLGFTSEYTANDKKNRNYRQAPQRFSHLRSYRAELFLKIKKEDFQDKEGKFYTSAYDMVMYFPLMELSCGRVNKIEGFHYLYNINTGLNDYAVDRGKQSRIDQTVRKAPKYECSTEFDQKMKELPDQ